MELQMQKQKTEGPEVKKPNLTGIPTQMKLDFERRSGLSFDDVRVHYNSDRPARLGALAYTQGTQIHIGSGHERSLPHELGHVIQQKAGRVRPTRWIGGLPVNDQPELEREADRAPVQCMPAPDLWGVIQMALPEMPHQRGANCGYHALARALLKFQKAGTVRLPYDQDNLEVYLTSYAIQTGFSVIGEAFDPYALAHVGNLFCQNSDIQAECVLRGYNSPEELKHILSTSGSVILVPYFPDPDTMDVLEKNSTHPKENAHWSAIDAAGAGSYELYEGNLHGSTGYPGATGPADVEPERLFHSNESIQPQFNWSQFILDTGYSICLSDFDSAEIDRIVDALGSDYKTYCLKNGGLPNTTDTKRQFILSEEGKQGVLRMINEKSLYQYGISWISTQKNNILGAGHDFADLDSVKDSVRTVVKNINSIRGSRAGLSFDPASVTQDVSLKGFAVEVKAK